MNEEFDGVIFTYNEGPMNMKHDKSLTFHTKHAGLNIRIPKLGKSISKRYFFKTGDGKQYAKVKMQEFLLGVLRKLYILGDEYLHIQNDLDVKNLERQLLCDGKIDGSL